jgi:leucyl-tRNA synthetase
LILLLAPGAPHSADELWSSLGHEGFTLHAEWPTFDEALAAVETHTIAVQVNGKLRGTFEVATGASEEEYVRLAMMCERVAPHLEGKALRKTIVVPGKLVNIVAS